MLNVFKKVQRKIAGKKQTLQKNKKYKKTVSQLRTRPFLSFFIVIGLLFLIILTGNLIGNLGKKETKKEVTAKPVEIYTIGDSPKVTLQGKVNQESVVEIIAQTPGIVSEVYVYEGSEVTAGQTLVSLSSNYQGGNAPGLQSQLAYNQYKNIKDTFDTQKEIINKQRELTEKSNNNTEELRKISDSAEGDTRGLLELNENILETLSNTLDELEQNNASEAEILQAQQFKSQAQAGVNQLRNALKNLEYSTNTDNPPTKLSDLQKDISLKQLSVQEKALELSRETSRIQYNLSLIQASLMRPASPFHGTVEKVHVFPGQSVNPGTVIATVSSSNPQASLTVMVPQEIAESISRAQPSIFTISGKKVEIFPAYISSVATNKQLYTVLYNLPKEHVSKVSNNSFIPVEVPIGYADTVASVPFIPIDSVFQSQNESYVFLEKNKKAVSQEITLGSVYGSYVEVTNGINNGDKIILNRSVVSGDKVSSK